MLKSSRDHAPNSTGPERVLESFASLLSSALTTNGNTSAPISTSSGNLPRLIAPTVPEDTNCCTVPCLMLKHNSSSGSNSQSSLEDKASLYLARPLSLTKNELDELPTALLSNISESFMSLVEARLRSSLAALMRHPEVHNEHSITRAVVGILTASCDQANNNRSLISPTAVVTSFRVLPVTDRTQDGDYVAPLVMETVIDLSILNQLVTVTVVSPGTIQGTFDSLAMSDGLPTKLVIVLDTAAFLKAMMGEARSVVREAVHIASGVASSLFVSYLHTTEASAANGKDETSEQNPSSTTTNGCKTSAKNHNGNGASDMQPPLPRRPSASKGDHTPDLPPEDANDCTDVKRRASSGSEGSNPDGGLSLLTAAAIGLTQDSTRKKRRLEGLSPTQGQQGCTGM